MLAVVLTIVLVPNVARSYDWSRTSIKSGYAVTTDWHGTDVPLGEPVTARAGTTDLSVETVWFRWLRPNGKEAWTVEVSWDGTSDTWIDQTVRVFVNTQIPEEVGDWGVQAIFSNSESHGRGPLPDSSEKVAIRARSFFAIPEVSFGTIEILITMFGALAIFAIKKKRIPLIRTARDH